MRYSLFISFLLFLSCSKNHLFYSVNQDSQIALKSLASPLEKEVFNLKEAKSKVDILIVADTSRSMSHRLSQLGQSLSDLLSVIVDYDWQIGITSADHGDHGNPTYIQQSWRDYYLRPHGRFGGLMSLEDGKRILDSKILTPKVKGYENIFLQSLSHGVQRDCARPPFCHARLEQPLRSLKSAMQRSVLDNKTFFRSSANFVSLIITNEEERAEDRSRATTAEQVVQVFHEMFGHLNKNYVAFNILIKNKNCLMAERQHSPLANFSHSIDKLAEITGGYKINICSGNYGPVLKQLYKHIKNSLFSRVILRKEPVPESLQYKFEGGKS